MLTESFKTFVFLERSETQRPDKIKEKKKLAGVCGEEPTSDTASCRSLDQLAVRGSQSDSDLEEMLVAAPRLEGRPGRVLGRRPARRVEVVWPGKAGQRSAREAGRPSEEEKSNIHNSSDKSFR